MIRFTDSADSIPEYPMSRVILIDASLQSKDAVIDRIEKALEAPYNEDNWDGFRDAITDLSWLACPSVVLVHKALPKMNAWDLKTYLELLYDVSKEWDSGNCEKGFYVYFSLEDKPQIDFYLPGKRLSPQVKEGRRAPAVHIGDVFEIPLPDNRKRYLQFVIVDSSQLGAWCVRVFKKDYSIDETPSVEDIVKDSVDFYCNTRAIGRGVQYGLWSYYGKSSNRGNLDDIVFRTFQGEIPGLSQQRWRVWVASKSPKYFSVLPQKYLKAADGSMCPPIWVIYRIIAGRWHPFPNAIDDYKGATLMDRLRGRDGISDDLTQ